MTATTGRRLDLRRHGIATGMQRLGVRLASVIGESDHRDADGCASRARRRAISTSRPCKQVGSCFGLCGYSSGRVENNARLSVVGT